MNILCFGAGAIGTYIGGSLAYYGHQVVFLENPEIVDELNRFGLQINLLRDSLTISAPIVVSNIREALALSPFDIGIFALKSFDTQMALAELTPFQDSMPPILCLQNGIDNEKALELVLGESKVIPGTVTSAIGKTGVGKIQLERLRGIGIASNHPLSNELVNAFNAAGLRAKSYTNAVAMKWSKMLTNLIANASSAILDMTPAEIFANEELYRLEIRQLRETLNVMEALGIRVIDLPGVPVSWLAFAVRSLPASLSGPFIRRSVGSGRGGKMPSLHIDLHSGRGKSEVDYLNGAVVRFGQNRQIPTPINRVLNETLLGMIERRLDLTDFSRQPNKLLSLID